MRLIAIRHLQTDWNLLGKLQGSNDRSILPASEETLEQIRSQKATIHETFQDPDEILVSPLKRTHETASLYGYSEQTKIEELIQEIQFAQYEGRDKIWMQETLGKNWFENPYETDLGDEVRKLEGRIEQFIDKYKSKSEVLIFSHGVFIRGLMSYHKHKSLSKMNTFKVSNNQLVLFEF